MEPDTPTFTKALPGGSSFATRAGQDPVAGSVAPTPTVSDAPIATYRVAAVGDGVGVTVGLSVTRATVDEVEVAGAGVVAGDGGPEHPVTTRSARKRHARDKVRIDGA